MANKEEQIGAGQVIHAETFRDSVSTIEQTGSRKWVYPKKPKGKFTNYRDIVTFILLAIFFITPFLKINGNSMLKINIIDREFFIFGQPFYPQDFFILALGAITSLVFIILFTVIFGRIFCGWICPQTIFMEGVFRKIEFWIEGDRNKQIRLASQPWNAEKIWKKGLKWSVYVVISLIITHWMFMYIVGVEDTLKIMKGGPVEYPTNFIVMVIFTGLFYFVFAWFREQVCTLVCPYGRLQGVLIDKETVNVFYDYKRGENRAKWRKGEDRKAVGKGDCIDCNQCVVVCPTGIDIRNGTQLECVNCTACIDECDTIMEKVGLPKGLIRYASEDEIVNKEKFKLTTRMKGYIVVLTILVGVLISMLFLRNEVEATVLRMNGQMFEHKGENISNVFTYKIVNKTVEDLKNIHFKLKDTKGTIKVVGKENFDVKQQGLAQGTMFIEINQALLEGDKMEIEIEVYSGDKLIETATTNFMGPRTF